MNWFQSHFTHSLYFTPLDGKSESSSAIEWNLLTFHRSFIVHAKDVEHIVIQIPTLSTNTIPIKHIVVTAIYIYIYNI
jgi:hypothetical protein